MMRLRDARHEREAAVFWVSAVLQVTSRELDAAPPRDAPSQSRSVAQRRVL